MRVCARALRFLRTAATNNLGSILNAPPAYMRTSARCCDSTDTQEPGGSRRDRQESDHYVVGRVTYNRSGLPKIKSDIVGTESEQCSVRTVNGSCVVGALVVQSGREFGTVRVVLFSCVYRRVFPASAARNVAVAEDRRERFVWCGVARFELEFCPDPRLPPRIV